MNNVDFAIIVIMGLSCIFGLIRGFTREILGLFTWAGAGASTYFLVPMLGGIARDHIANPMIADTITAVLLFIVLLIVFSVISGLIANTVKQSNMGGVDRSLGFAYGIARGGVVVCIIEIAFSVVVARPQQAASIQEARFTPLVRRGADSLMTFMPQKALDMIASQTVKAVDKAQQQVQEQVTQQVQDLMQNPGQPLTSPSSLTNPALQLPEQVSTKQIPPAQSVKTPEDSEKTVESLALLTPHAAASKNIDGDYNKHQKRDMDRLIQATQ